MTSPEQIIDCAESKIQLIADAANDLIVPTPLEQSDHRLVWLAIGGFCGLASEVLRQALISEGVEASTIINHGASFGGMEDHVIVRTESDQGQLYLDPTYLRGLSPFGFDAEFHRLAFRQVDEHDFPYGTLFAYRGDEYAEACQIMAGYTSDLFRSWSTWELWNKTAEQATPRPQEQPNQREVLTYFERIYNPKYFTDFEQEPDKQQMIAEFLAEYRPNSISLRALEKLLLSRLVPKNVEPA